VFQGEDLSEKMSPYIRIQSIHSGARAETSNEDQRTRLWPLVKNVEVTIPSLQVLPAGVVFVDIPGMGDFNSKRDAMWKKVTGIGLPWGGWGCLLSVWQCCGFSCSTSDADVWDPQQGCGEQGNLLAERPG